MTDEAFFIKAASSALPLLLVFILCRTICGIFSCTKSSQDNKRTIHSFTHNIGKIAPDDPTSAPVIINAVFSKVKPIPAAAHPEYELNIEITTFHQIGIIKKPIKNETANNIQNKLEDCVEHNKQIKTTIDINIIAFRGCCPLNVIGDPDIIPCNLERNY